MRVVVVTWVLVAVVGAVLVGGCSSTPPICSSLANGQSTLEAARNAYPDSGGDRNAAQRSLLDGARTVRASCPEYERAAGELEKYAQLVASR